MPKHARRRRSMCAAILAALVAGAISACGSSSHDANGAAASGTSSHASTIQTQLGRADVNKVYAPGVPTLAQLYKGTETKPPATSPPIAKNKSIVFMSCGQTADGCSEPAADLGKVAKMVGWKYNIVDGQLDVNNGYATAMSQAIAEKPSAIVLYGVNCPEVKQGIEDARAAHIPVFGSGGADCSDPLTAGGAGQSLFSGDVEFNKQASDLGKLYEQIGEEQAATAVDVSQGKAQVIRTNFEGTFGLWQQRGQSEVLAKCSGCKVVANVNWTPADSAANGPLFQQFTTDLTRNPNADVALFSADSIATGGGLAESIVNQGRAHEMYAIACEGFAAGMTLIRANDEGLQAEPSYDANWIAWATVDELNRYFHHEALAPEGIGIRLVDTTHNLPPAGDNYTAPVDFEAAYKKAWGIG